MSSAVKFSDVNIERSVLKNLVQNADFSKSAFIYQTITKSHFTDLFHKDIFTTTKNYFSKFGTMPDQEKLKTFLIKNITYNNKYKTKDNQLKIWLKASERIHQPLTPQEIINKEADVLLLEEMRKARVLQKFFVGAESGFNEGKYEDVLSLMGDALNDVSKIDNVVMEGNIVGDFGQHIQLIRQKKLGTIKPVSTGITGVQESENGDWKLVELDNWLDGGLYPGEMTLIIGENNVGKSFALMEVPVNVSMNKMNSVIFTIEMNKMKQEMRIYSRITGIPYSKFRKGDLTKKELKKWKDKLDWWKSECGILQVVSFDKGCTSVDIENKLKDLENKYGEEFSQVSIDYLNDMKPIGKYQSLKGWDAMGEISWDLANLAKRHNNHKGIPILTANQKKTNRAGTSSTDWQDAAFSPLPVQHATIGIGIGQDENDEEIGRVRWNIFKNRDGEKSVTFFTYPNFACARINSKVKMAAYYDMKDDEKSK